MIKEKRKQAIIVVYIVLMILQFVVCVSIKDSYTLFDFFIGLLLVGLFVLLIYLMAKFIKHIYNLIIRKINNDIRENSTKIKRLIKLNKSSKLYKSIKPQYSIDYYCENKGHYNRTDFDYCIKQEIYNNIEEYEEQIRRVNINIGLSHKYKSNVKK